MSRSSSPDMVTYDTTTPARPLAVKTTSSRRPPARSIASTSKRPVKPSRPKKSGQDLSEIEVDQQPEHIEIPSTSGEEELVEPPKPQVKKGTARGAPASLNGKTSAKGKGKAKEHPRPTHQDRDDPPDTLMDIDEIQDLTHPIQDDAPKLPARPHRSVRDTDFVRVQRQLQESQKQVEILKTQIAELLQTQTESGHALEDWKAQHEAGNETYNAYRRELDSIQRSASSKSSLALHFLSREDADEEKRTMETGIVALQQTIQEKDSVISQKDTRIAELEAAERVLQSDLMAEIDRGKALTAKSKPTGHHALSEISSMDTHKKAAVTRLYEDFTNILVLHVKTERNDQVEKDDILFSCLYTHSGENEDVTNKTSISFQLRLYSERRDGVLVENVKYTPLDLDKEPPEFRDRLEFLADTFTFEKHQVQVFLEQLRERVAGAVDPDADPEDGKDVIDLRSDDGEDLYA